MPSDTDNAQSILPSNATAFERALSRVGIDAVSVPVPIRDLWNPWTCPAKMLPYLAWTLHVDDWDSNWTEDQKRGAIANSVAIHRAKGTVGAIRRALSALGYEVQINEDTGEAYTFRVALDVSVTGLTDDSVFNEAARIANNTKNARSKLLGVDALIKTNGVIYAATTAISGELTTVAAEVITFRSVDGNIYTALAEMTADTVTIYPQPHTFLFWGNGQPITWPNNNFMTA